MRRREFLTASAGLAVLPGLVRAQSKPCPPPAVNVGGGSSVTTSCGPGAAPGWFTALSHKQWLAPLRNSLAAVIDPLATSQPNVADSGHPSIINAWTGMGAD